MTDMQRNAFKHALAAEKLQIGLWSSLCSNIAAEIISDSGFDWILLDTEHSPNEIPDLVGQLQAMQGSATTPIIRPAWNDAVLAKRALDIGAQTLLFPYVQNAEEAKRAVASTRYPPPRAVSFFCVWKCGGSPRGRPPRRSPRGGVCGGWGGRPPPAAMAAHPVT